MQIKLVTKVLGILLMIFSVSMLPPIIVSIIFNDNEVWSFLYALFFILLAGSLMWFPTMQVNENMKLRDGFIVVVLFWIVLSLCGALPLILSENIFISYTDAFFESVSGLTTTGATIFSDLTNVPESILFYRQYLQWLGGLGIIVLAIAILPTLGIGGMQLYKAEVAGPLKNKLTPRITETAKALWFIYFLLTLTCMLLYWLAGMTLFDAICHSFSTISIGGFSTHNESFEFFNNHFIEIVAIIFMLLASLNFSLHYLAFSRFSIKPYIQDKECNYFFYIIFFITGISILYFFQNTHIIDYNKIIKNVFQSVSIVTTTGFTNSTYGHFIGFLPIFLILFSFIGGCAGSTAGGMKVIRFSLLIKQGNRELKKLLHPNGKFNVRLGESLVNQRMMETVWGFFAVYISVFIFVMMLLMYSGLDLETSFSAVAATINNLGPGLGEVVNGYNNLSDFNKWLLSFSMIVGRLEVFTLLVILTPEFWRK